MGNGRLPQGQNNMCSTEELKGRSKWMFRRWVRDGALPVSVKCPARRHPTSWRQQHRSHK
jgi:hypothetical protein